MYYKQRIPFYQPLALLLVTACSIEPATTDSDDTQATSDTADSESSTTDTPTTDAPTTHVFTSDSDDPTTSDTSDPGSACPHSPTYHCTEAPECDDSCGVGTSRQDENGCPRPDCGSGCPDGMRCFEPALWGGCAYSYEECTEQEGVCECVISDDCGGAWCVPEDAFTTVPGISRFESTCAPNDGPAVHLRIGLEAETCNADYAAQQWLELQLWRPGPLAPGVYPIDAAIYNTSGDDPGPQVYGIVTIESWDNNVVSGSYLIGFENVDLAGDFSQTPYCDLQPMCG